MLPLLPQEIIYHILSNIPTKQLCTLFPTSKSMYLDVIGILHARLATHLLNKEDHKLIFEAFLPSDQQTVPFHMSTYTHTSPESPQFTSSLYSYFSLSLGNDDPGGVQSAAPSRATYSFTLSPDELWAQLALQGNLVKLSPHKPGVFKFILPCFERRDFVRLKRIKLNDLAETGEGEMVWVNDRKDVGVWTRVIDRSVMDVEEEIGRQGLVNQDVPMNIRHCEGEVKYTLVFDYLAMKTGFLLAKLDEMDHIDRNTMAIIWRGPNQGEL